MSDLKNIKEEFNTKLNNNLSLDEINQIKTELFGKNGLISSQFKNIGSIPDNDRKKFASDLNHIKDELQNLISNLDSLVQLFLRPIVNELRKQDLRRYLLPYDLCLL